MLKEVHDTHPGVSCIKSLGRMFVLWPGLDKLVRGCNECQLSRPAPPVAPLHPWAWPSRPWPRLHCDYAGHYLGHHFLVVIDAYSKWLEVCPITMISTTSTAPVERLRVLFARFGLPKTLVTDNGTNFASAEFAEFIQ